jgi:hypothetical protein
MPLSSLLWHPIKAFDLQHAQVVTLSRPPLPMIIQQLPQPAPLRAVPSRIPLPVLQLDQQLVALYLISSPRVCCPTSI